jgi:hypothetical protein
VAWDQHQSNLREAAEQRMIVSAVSTEHSME